VRVVGGRSSGRGRRRGRPRAVDARSTSYTRARTRETTMGRVRTKTVKKVREKTKDGDVAMSGVVDGGDDGGGGGRGWMDGRVGKTLKGRDATTGEVARARRRSDREAKTRSRGEAIACVSTRRWTVRLTSRRVSRHAGVSPNHREVLLSTHARLCDEQAHRG